MNITYKTIKDLPNEQLYKLFLAVGWADKTTTTPAMIDNFNQPFINSTIVISAWDKDVLIGCVSYLAFELDNEGMKIIALAVSKEYRRKGIGTELLKTAEQWAKENNIEVILLNSGLPREDAHKFYESQGYFKKSYGFIKRI